MTPFGVLGQAGSLGLGTWMHSCARELTERRKVYLAGIGMRSGNSAVRVSSSFAGEGRTAVAGSGREAGNVPR